MEVKPDSASRLACLSDAQLGLLEQLKQQLPHHSEGDNDWARWLYVGKWTLKSAKELYLAHQQWLSISYLNQLSFTDDAWIDQLGRMMGRTITGFDRLGRPIQYIQLGKVDQEFLLTTVPINKTAAAMLRLSRRQAQFARELSQKVDNPIDYYVNVIDLGGLSLNRSRKAMNNTISRQLTTIAHCHYPDTVKQILLVNGQSTLIEIVCKLLSQFLPSSTFGKVKVLRKQQDLLDYIEHDQLPADYGGTAPPLPPPLAVTPEIVKLFAPETFSGAKRDDIRITVKRDSNQLFCLTPSGCPANRTLRWQIAGDCEIDFEVAFSKHKEEHSELLLARPRLCCDLSDRAIQCTYTTPQDGFYFVDLANKSRMSNKTLVITVITP